MFGYDYLSTISGCTSDTPGRFSLKGQTFAIITDGSIGSGGPGRAPGPLDLLVSALVTNLLNVLRGDEVGTLEDEDRVVQVRARVTRAPQPHPRVGRLEVEVMIADHDARATGALLAEYQRGCRVLPALKAILDVTLTGVDATSRAA